MSTTPVGDRVRLFGIRHHGPGSARSLMAALQDWQPELLLVEGPVELGGLVPLLLDEALRPPVAALLYAVDKPRWAVYYPLVDFSPELQAFRWAAKSGCGVRMMDLPGSALLGLSVVGSQRSEVMAQIAEAAGFDDIEEWWEHLVEQRQDTHELFEAVDSLMCGIRELGTVSEEEVDDSPSDERKRISAADFEAMREAHMRRVIREALAEGHERVAVVCGAWHLPALKALPPARQDDVILKGLPKIKVGATVVPWSFDRLTFDSGYGAGARSPAFYELLWKSKPADVPTQWLLSVAHLLREADLDASPASVIEAVRLADALAAMRERPRPGLRELCDSARSILIWDEAVWSLIARRLIVGERMGEVPESVPMVPLLSDLVAHLKRLRMKQDDTDRLLQLDLRGEMDLERSQLLHRLNLLNVAWGVPEEVTGKKGTFHEHWHIQWRPELSISLIEAGIYGNTVVSAATNCAAERAGKAVQLADIATLVQQVLIADLADAIEPSVAKLQALSATSADIADLAEALPPLAAVVRYGTVRRTEAERVAPVLDAIFTRLCVGLPPACVSLDDDATGDMSDRLTAVSGIVTLFDNEEQSAQWQDALAAIATLEGCHRLVKGRAERLRFDFGAVDGEHLALRLGQESSAGATAQETAAFIEGLLEGPGVVLLHQEPLFRAINDWLVGLTAEHFDEVLPLVRRTFALFTKPERRQIGELVAGKGETSGRVMEINEERARRVLPFVRQILGLPNE